MSPLWYASRGLAIVMFLTSLFFCFHGALYALSAFLDRGTAWNRYMRQGLIRLVLALALLVGGIGVAVAADHAWPSVSTQEEKEGETDG